MMAAREGRVRGQARGWCLMAFDTEDDREPEAISANRLPRPWHVGSIHG